MSNNLNLTQLLTDQVDKEETVNDITGELDAAITETYTADVTSSNISISEAAARAAIRIYATGAAVERTVTLPQIKRMLLLQTDEDNLANVTFERGTASAVLSPGQASLIYLDGTANGLYSNVGSSVPSLDDLTDVDILSPDDWDVLRYDLLLGKWINQDFRTLPYAVQSVSGTKTVPGYAIGEANTGLFLLAAGKPALSANGIEMMRMLSTMGVAIGVGAEFDPTQLLHIRQVGGAGRLLVEAEGGAGIISARYSSNNSPVSYVGRKFRGTIDAPLIVASGDRVFSIEGVAWSGSSNISVATFEYVIAAATPSTTDLETRAVLSLAPAASITPTEVMRVQSAQGLMMYGANVVVDANRLIALRNYTVAALPSAATAGAGKMAYATDIGGGNGLVISDGTSWRRVQELGTNTRTSDANYTLTPLSSAPIDFHEGTLTAARTVTLSTTGAYDGCSFTIRRTGGGAFPLNVAYGSGGASTKAIYQNAWATFVYSASAGYWKRVAAGWLETPRPISFFFTTTPTTSEVLLLYTSGEYITLADDFAGSVGDVGTNPTASFVLDVQKNGVSVGSITISTGGAFTFNTTGTTVALAPGDQLKVVGPATPDATVANVSISFMGTLD